MFDTRQLVSSVRTDPVKALQSFNLMRFITTLLIGILLAKSGLPTGDISLYETWLFFGNLVTFFWLGGGQNALVSLFPKLENPEQQRVLLFQSFVLFNVLGLIAAGILALGGDWVGPRFAHADNIPYLPWLILFLVANAPSMLIHLFYLLQNRPGGILRYGMISFVMQLVAVAVPLFSGAGLEGIFISLVVWAGIKWIWLLVLTIRFGKPQWNGVLMRQLIWLMLPLTLHILIGNSVEYTDGLIVANFFQDERQFALFRFGARELPLTTLLVGGIVTGLIPLVVRDFETGLAELKQRTARLAHVLFPLSACLMFLSAPVFPLIYNPEFSVSARVFNIYLLILCSRILLPQVLVIGRQHNFFLVFSAIVETVINVALSLWWVRFWGLQGIAMGSVVAFLVNKFNLIVYNYRVFGVPVQRYVPVRLWLGYSLGLGICYFLATWIYG